MLRRKLVFTSFFRIERFRDGREAVEDDEGRGRPTISKNNEKIDFVRRRWTIDGLADS